MEVLSHTFPSELILSRAMKRVPEKVDSLQQGNQAKPSLPIRNTQTLPVSKRKGRPSSNIAPVGYLGLGQSRFKGSSAPGTKKRPGGERVHVKPDQYGAGSDNRQHVLFRVSGPTP